MAASVAGRLVATDVHEEVLCCAVRCVVRSIGGGDVRVQVLGLLRSNLKANGVAFSELEDHHDSPRPRSDAGRMLSKADSCDVPTPGSDGVGALGTTVRGALAEADGERVLKRPRLTGAAEVRCTALVRFRFFSRTRVAAFELLQMSCGFADGAERGRKKNRRGGRKENSGVVESGHTGGSGADGVE